MKGYDLMLNNQTIILDTTYLWPEHDVVDNANELVLRYALRTLPNMNTIGVIHFDQDYYMSYLHMNKDDFNQAFHALEKRGHVFKYCRETNELILKDFISATNHSLSSTKREMIITDIENTQSPEIIEYLYKSLKNNSKPLRGKYALLKYLKRIVKRNAIN
jgi:hypothetical protein